MIALALLKARTSYRDTVNIPTLSYTGDRRLLNWRSYSSFDAFPQWSADFVFVLAQSSLLSPSMMILIHWQTAFGPAVKKDDGMPDMICLSCENNLESLNTFRNVCLQSIETSKLRLDIKTEEVFLEDLICEDESDVDSPTIACNFFVNEWERSDYKKDINLSENINPLIRCGKITSCDYRPKMEGEISPEGPPLLKASDKICSTNSESTHKTIFQDVSNRVPKLQLQRKNCARFKCEICSKSFPRKSKLMRHLKSHTGEKPYKCNICLKPFAEKSNLAAHLKYHSGEKPYRCDVCLKSFTQKCFLVVHETSHTGEKPYKCSICLKSFTQKSSLGRHEKSHAGVKPYKCDICLKSFAEKSNLAAHTNSHAGIKPYRCDICLKSFSKKYDLVRHERVHTG
ncbi:uncharacterized protein LOC143911979 [Arctopsyche grandis]|uniref:uncharacterized protein LOC143911979 n=1 Tax=Arctopsyche grandis TaxID=121162 RepID=UPI00406D6FE8